MSDFQITPRRRWQSRLMFCISLFVVTGGLYGCIKISNSFNAVPPGIWRATLHLSVDSADIAEERTKGLLPFTFEVVYITEDSFHIIIRNAEERIVCTDIDFALDRSIGKDTIRITLPAFGTYITAKYEEDAIEGHWWDPSRGDHYRIPFKAYHGRDYRFALDAEAGAADFSGSWKALFSVESPSPYPAIVKINQDGNHVTGTILTETGDYRYLEGNVENDRLFLSTFDGTHAYLFEAKLLADSTISGVYRSGNHYKTYWTAERNAEYTLSDPYSLTTVKDPQVPFDFTFENITGDSISLSDPRYADKPVIVNIFGTWCPNCLDEMTFLTEYLNAHPEKGVEVISIGYERHQEKIKAVNALRNYKTHFAIPWEVLYGGSYQKQHVAASLPMLNNFRSFPTLLFLDHKHRVVKIHSGFFGPATDQYATFVKSFEETMNTLTAQIQ